MHGWTLLATDGGPTHDLSIFDPASPDAQSIVTLSVLACAIFGLIFFVVEAVLLYCVWRFRQAPGDPATEPAQVYGSKPIEVAWTAAPTMIVFFLVLVTTRTLWEVNAAPPAPKPDDNALFVTVVGRQWWWEYAYETYNGRKLGFTTANELHIPASDKGSPRPAHLILKSADVCHSYWVPRLGGKVDLIPGRTNSLTLRTSEPGLYLGQCAEYCGTQHANMLIRVVVDTPDEFESWLENQMLPAEEDRGSAAQKDRDSAAERDRQAFLAQSCINCHRVRGTKAQGTYAPDLTHLMSRETLASGEIENTPDNLARWVHDPQPIKPGCLMPAFGLSPADEESIVRYLRTLR